MITTCEFLLYIYKSGQSVAHQSYLCLKKHVGFERKLCPQSVSEPTSLLIFASKS